MNCRIVLLLFSIAAGATSPAYAVWIGRGEVVGQVESSKFVGLSGDRVQFVLTIESQTNELGPPLGDGNTFVYSGAGMESISAGDGLCLRVNSSNNDGIVVESIEFITDQPGSPLRATRSYTVSWVVLGLAGGLALIVYLAVRSKTNRKDSEAAA